MQSSPIESIHQLSSDLTVTAFFAKRSRHRLGQTFLAILLAFVNGSTFSVGIFSVSIQKSSKSRILDGVWESSLGYVHLFSAPVMVYAGIHLTHASSRTAAVRSLSTIAALGFALFALSAPAVQALSAAGTTFAVSFLALPLGIYALISAEISLQSNPNAPGLALGLISVAFGFGSAVYAYLFNTFLNSWTLDTAIYASSASLSVPCLVSTPFLSLPDITETEYDSSETPLMSPDESFPRLTLRRLVQLYDFWLFIFASLTAGASYALVPYFFSISSSFKAPLKVAVGAFQASSIAAVILSLALTGFTDCFAWGTGFFSLGSRNVMVAMLSVQTALCAALCFSTLTRWYGLFAVSAGMLKTIMAAHASCSALMAHDVFGAVNSALVIGVGSGLALGSGEAASVFIMSLVERSSQLQYSIQNPMVYQAFYYVLALWTIIGLIALIFLRRKASLHHSRNI